MKIRSINKKHLRLNICAKIRNARLKLESIFLIIKAYIIDKEETETRIRDLP